MTAVTDTRLPKIPKQLREIPNWVWWKLVKTTSGGATKEPFISGTNKHASSTDSATWVDFETAITNCSLLDSTQGIGFVIQGAAVELGLVGFDIDGCRNPETGEITPWAYELIECLDSYTEITPSRTGVRIWVIGKLPGKDRVFNLAANAGHGSKVKIEVFDRARYFTVTGDELGTMHSPIVSQDLSEAYQLCHDIRDRFPVEPISAQSASIEAAISAAPAFGTQIKNTGTAITCKLSLLMSGKVVSDLPFVIQDGQGNSLEYPSHSEADLSLCTGLALKYGNDPEKIRSEFAQSPLHREKWDREDYSQKTIAKAIETADKIKSEMAARLNSSSSPVAPVVIDDPYETLQPNATEDFKELLRRSRLSERAPSWLSQHAEMPHQMAAPIDEWLADRMFRRRGVSEIAAEQGSFKSILALFWALALMKASTSQDGEGSFLGRKVRTNFGDGDSRPLVIYYIDNDSPRSLTKKNCLRVGINKDTNTGGFKIYGAYMEFPVTTIDDPRLIEAARRERAYFIFDTLSKVFEGMNENDPVDANLIMTKSTRLAYASEGVLILHHDSKDGAHGYRGSTPIVAVPDMCFALSRKKGENVAILKEIRFKDVEYYEIRIEFFFELIDSRAGGLVIREGYSCKVLSDSLLEREKSLTKPTGGKSSPESSRLSRNVSRH